MDKDYFMHNKFMIIDNKHLITGSYNFTEQAEKINIENIITIRDNKKIANEYSEEFSKLLKYSILIKKINRIERSYINNNTFKKPAKNNDICFFEIIKVDLSKKFLTLKDENNNLFYLNTNKEYTVGNTLKISHPIQIKDNFKVKNGFLNLYRWIINPKIVD